MKWAMHWGSHIPVLDYLMSVTDGDVLEIGMGVFSTPMLHWLCISDNRYLLSVENNSVYYHMFERDSHPLHRALLMSNLMDVDLSHDGLWSIVFIDSIPDQERKELAGKVANNANYVVLHDSQPQEDAHYRYSEIYPLFKFKYDYKKFKWWTTVLSNFHPLEALREHLG